MRKDHLSKHQQCSPLQRIASLEGHYSFIDSIESTAFRMGTQFSMKNPGKHLTAKRNEHKGMA